jgi:hypothetical protein
MTEMALRSIKRLLVGLVVAAMVVALAALPALALTKVFVTDVSPDGSSANVVASSNVTATFNIRMAKSTINNKTFYLKQEGSSAVVPAKVTYSGTTKTATLNPNNDLAHGETYTAYVKGGRTGVKGTGGQKLGGTNDATATFLNAKVSWTFTVAEEPIVDPPIGDVTITPDPLTFTSDALCFPESKFLTVKNEGLSDVTFANVSITGPDAARFSTGSQQFLANNGPFTVLAGNFFRDEVTFIPTGGPPQPRTYSATLTYKDATGATLGDEESLTAKTGCLVF